MEQLLKPERFDIDPTCSNAETKWRHWKKTFENFLGGIKTLTEENKLPLLSNYVTSNVYQFINDCTTYTGAIAILDSLFIKKRNVIFARHCLSTRNQQTEETVSEYLQVLNQLSKDCDFTDVKAEEYRKEYIRDAFIRGLKCPRIRQRLLENTSMTLDQAFEQARTLESAEVHAASYMGNSFPVQSAAMKTDDFSEETLATSAASSSSRSQKCFFCGNDLHSRTICPARDVFCRKCGKKGHYQRVCKSRPEEDSDETIDIENDVSCWNSTAKVSRCQILQEFVKFEKETEALRKLDKEKEEKVKRFEEYIDEFNALFDKYTAEGDDEKMKQLVCKTPSDFGLDSDEFNALSDDETDSESNSETDYPPVKRQCLNVLDEE
ncbi:uncharacterized protein NPIL_249201 [Nephila pilipes]|uniref:CCHC-type domain-containing protein n=1 Tax=Nephila pilipes TaxID=299642 RepID=A0A8X6U2T1_NEPPI|nr:uncharacterized protein NPIL_249201 [Nephila pilipes]